MDGGSGDPTTAASSASGRNIRPGGVRRLVTSQIAEAAAYEPVAARVIRRVYAVHGTAADAG